MKYSPPFTLTFMMLLSSPREEITVHRYKLLSFLIRVVKNRVLLSILESFDFVIFIREPEMIIDELENVIFFGFCVLDNCSHLISVGSGYASYWHFIRMGSPSSPNLAFKNLDTIGWAGMHIHLYGKKWCENYIQYKMLHCRIFHWFLLQIHIFLWRHFLASKIWSSKLSNY